MTAYRTQSGDDAREPRVRIIETAEALFASKGFEGVSIRDIAERARVNSAMIYYYFGNKNGLYRGIIERALGELTDILEKTVPEGKDPIDRLKRYISAHVAYLRYKAKTAQLMFQIIYSSDSHVDELVENYWARHFQMVEGILREGVEAGCFRLVDTRMTAISLRGMILWYFMSSPIIRLYPGMEGYPEEFDDRLSEHILDLIMRGLCRENG